LRVVREPVPDTEVEQTDEELTAVESVVEVVGLDESGLAASSVFLDAPDASGAGGGEVGGVGDVGTLQIVGGCGSNLSTVGGRGGASSRERAPDTFDDGRSTGATTFTAVVASDPVVFGLMLEAPLDFLPPELFTFFIRLSASFTSSPGLAECATLLFLRRRFCQDTNTPYPKTDARRSTTVPTEEYSNHAGRAVKPNIPPSASFAEELVPSRALVFTVTSMDGVGTAVLPLLSRLSSETLCSCGATSIPLASRFACSSATNSSLGNSSRASWVLIDAARELLAM